MENPSKMATSNMHSHRPTEGLGSKKQMPLRFTLSQQHGLTPRVVPSDYGDDEQYQNTCGKCDQDIVSSSESEDGHLQAVMCDVCKTYYHQKCGGLSDDLFDIVTRYGMQGTQEIPWHCSICRKYAKGMMDEMVNLKRRQDKLEKDVKLIKEQINGAQDKTGTNNTSLHETVKEVLEQEKRQLNIVVSNLPEITSASTPRAVLKATKELFQNKLQVNPNEVDKTDIIPTERGALVKVQMKNKSSKRTALSNAKDLRNDEVYRNVYLKPDLTYQQRRKEAELRQEVRRRKENGEKNLKIVRGVITIVKPPSDQGT